MDEYNNTNTNSNEIEEQAVEPTTEVTVNVTETPKKGYDIGRKILKGAEAGLAVFGAVTLIRRIRDNFRCRKELAAELKKKLKKKLKKAKEEPTIEEASAENQ